MGFAHQPPALQLGGKIAVWQGLIAQQMIGVVDQEPRRIEHHQHFRSQRFGHRLAGFFRDGFGDF